MEDSEQNRKLFLGGLNYNTTEETLKNYFGQFGELTDVVVMRFPDSKRSRGFGFITFSTPEEADTCFQAGPHSVDDKALDIKKATPREDKDAAGPKGEVLRKLFIGGLNYETTDEGLKTYFEQFGEVVDCIVMKYKDTNRSRGFGFVTYSSVEMVDAVQQNRPHKIDNKEVETKRATPRENAGESGKTVKKVFIGGLKDDIEDKDIEEYFSNYGTVVKVEQMTDKATGKKRGFGFVEFDDYDPVDKMMQVPRHSINERRIDIRKALGKNEVGGGGGRGGRAGGPSPWGGQGYGGGFGNGGYGGGNFGNSGWGGNQGGGYGGNPWQGGDSWGGNQGNGWSNGNSGYMTGEGGWGGGYGSGNAGMSAGGGAMRNSMGGANRSMPYSVGGRGGRGGRGGAAGGGGGRW